MTPTLLLLGLCLGFCFPYEFRCPHPWERRFVAKKVCQSISEKSYYCLYNNLNNKFTESCNYNPETSNTVGEQIVLNHRFQGSECLNKDKYQPFKFKTNVNSDCVFVKSNCSENGQIVWNRGKTDEDRYCLCDFHKGFAFLNNNISCKCKPDSEDCSCYKKSCKSTDILYSDYRCISKNNNSYVAECPYYGESEENEESKPEIIQLIPLPKDFDDYDNWIFAAKIATTVSFVLLMIAFISISLFLKYVGFKADTPYNVGVTAENGYFQLRWSTDYENDDIMMHKIHFTGDEWKNKKFKEVPGDNNVFALKNIDILPSTIYRFKMSTTLMYTYFKESEMSKESVIHSGCPPTPTNVQSAGQNGRVKLFWSASQEQTVFVTDVFLIEMKLNKETIAKVEVKAGDQEHVFSKITKGCTYCFSVYACSKMSSGTLVKSLPIEHVFHAGVAYEFGVPIEDVQQNDITNGNDTEIRNRLEQAEAVVEDELNSIPGEQRVENSYLRFSSVFAVFIISSDGFYDDAVVHRTLQKTVQSGTFGSFRTDPKRCWFKTLNKPLPPQSVEISVVHDCLRITWSEPPKTFFKVEKFRVQYTTDDWKTLKEAIISAEKRCLEISEEVSPLTTYRCRIYTRVCNSVESLPSAETVRPVEVSEMTGKLHIDPLWLNEVLDLIGISENMRKLYQQFGTRFGILDTLTHKDYSAYTFGSSCEGTTTPGMASDVDLMKCDSKFVIEFCNPGLPGRYRLIVRDENTRPGYVKLQLVEDGKPLTSSDWEMIPKELRYLFKVDLKDRIVISMEPIIGEEVGPEREIHGPAERLKVSSLMELDNVYSCRCASWPPFAMKWIFRQREYNWPPDDIIEQFQNWACFLVRTGHPLSEEKELEWRISFSLQERALVFSFNETQYKCFVLLKLIKDDIIKTDIGESITSYHCKTCMFYALEETPEQMWVKSNLLKCLMYCLKLLLSYVESWNCPNYFIPNENMFDRLERCSTQTRLKNLITGLIDEGPPFLLRIKTDKIGEYLSNVRDCSKILELKEFSKNCVASMACSLHWGLVTEVLLVKNLLLHKLNTLTQESNFDLVIKHHALLDKLLNTNVITEHSQDQTEDAIGMVIPFIQSSTACHLMSYALQEKNQTVRNVLTVVAAKHFSESIKSDVSSSRMKFATVLLNLGHYDSCAKLLDTVEVEFKNGTSLMNTCTCRELPPMLGEKLSKNVKYDNIQTNEFLQSYVSTCVMFLPSEIHIIPEALRFEMFRSAGTPSDSLMKMAEICYKCSAVDSIVYLYFMRYLLAVKEGKQKQIRDLAIKNIEQSLNQSLNHRETACNLLAWVLFRETCYIRAIKSLIASWRELEGYDLYLHKTDIMKDFQSHHIAAKWHMLVFLYNLWTNNIDSEKYKFCFGCLEPDLNRDVLITCSQCHVAKYCSKKCQAKDWRNHKTACRMKAKSDLLA